MTQTQTRTALEISNVSITFASKRGRVTALEGVDLDVEAGEFITIAGPSGCGKSTLLKAVAGLTIPSAGLIRLNGEDVTGPRQDIGYVFQRAALLEWRLCLAGERLLVVCHDMPILAFRYVIEELSPEDAVALSGQVKNCSVTKYEHAGRHLALRAFSDTTALQLSPAAPVTAHE